MNISKAIIVAVIGIVVIAIVAVSALYFTQTGQETTSPPIIRPETTSSKTSTTRTTTSTVQRTTYRPRTYMTGNNYNIRASISLLEPSDNEKEKGILAILKVTIVLDVKPDTVLFLKSISVDNLPPNNPLYNNLTKTYEEPGMMINGKKQIITFTAYISSIELVNDWYPNTHHTIYVKIMVGDHEKIEQIDAIVSSTFTPPTQIPM